MDIGNISKCQCRQMKQTKDSNNREEEGLQKASEGKKKPYNFRQQQSKILWRDLKKHDIIKYRMQPLQRHEK